MSKYLNRPVAYLEDNDFSQTGDIINPDIPIHKPVVVLSQVSWCPHCVAAKPDFQQFADENEDEVFCCTIQADGERSGEIKLGERAGKFKKIAGAEESRGYPDYLLYINGKIVLKEIKGRKVKDLEDFVKM